MYLNINHALILNHAIGRGSEVILMSVSTEEYLEALYTLTQHDRNVGTSELSKRLGIAPGSVTEMVKKLSENGYVNYAPYKGVTLTDKGLRIATKMTRKHRLLERFLHDVLKIGNDKVHQEACELEHALSDETERALCLTLKSPDRCPDDENIIPACELAFPSCEECRNWTGDNPGDIHKRNTPVVSVSSLKEHQHGKVAFIRGEKKILQRLLDLGLTPGTKVSVTRVAPLQGPTEISVRGCKLALGNRIASNVFVEKTE